MNQPKYIRNFQVIFALTGVLFGLVTIVAGMRVLTGFDPGYVVFLPLVIYNTAMGIAYIGAGGLGWNSLARGRNAAATIFMLNILVLAIIWFLYKSGGAVAVDSLRAMTLRTVVWLLLSIGFWWLGGRVRSTEVRPQ